MPVSFPIPPPQRSKFSLSRGENLDRCDETMHLTAALALDDGGVVSRRKLLAAGIGTRKIDSWIKRGYLRPFHTGVYAVGSARVPEQGHLMAALSAYGPTAVLSHETAVAIWRLGEIMSPVHVMVTTGTMTTRRGIALHRDRRLQDDETTRVRGLRVTTVPRMIFDLARVTRLDPMLDLTTAALRRGLLHLEDLHVQIDRQQRRKGVRELRRVVSLLDPETAKTRSWMERFFRGHWTKHRLPEYETNAKVAGMEVDCLWRRQKLIVELDSRAYHSDPSQFERDGRRVAALTAQGYTVLRITYRMLTESPDRTIARVADTLRSLSSNRASTR